MGNVVDKKTGQLIMSVNTPDYDPVNFLIQDKESPLPGLTDLVARKVDPKYWVVGAADVSEMPADQKGAVDKATLETYKLAYYDSLGAATQVFIESHYKDRKQRTLTFMYAEANANGAPDVAAYIQQAWNWVLKIIRVYHALQPRIMQAASVEEVQSFTIDFKAFEAADPKITTEQALVLRDAVLPVAAVVAVDAVVDGLK